MAKWSRDTKLPITKWRTEMHRADSNPSHSSYSFSLVYYRNNFITYGICMLGKGPKRMWSSITLKLDTPGKEVHWSGPMDNVINRTKKKNNTATLNATVLFLSCLWRTCHQRDRLFKRPVKMVICAAVTREAGKSNYHLHMHVHVWVVIRCVHMLPPAQDRLRGLVDRV